MVSIIDKIFLWQKDLPDWLTDPPQNDRSIRPNLTDQSGSK
jgi:hypothetical protein